MSETMADDFRIFTTEHTTVEQVRQYPVPGYLIVRPKSGCETLAGLAPIEGADLFACIARGEALASELAGAERVYVLKFAEVDRRVHFHVVPRTAAIEAAYLAEVDDARPVNGARLVAWLWQRAAVLGHDEAALSDFVRVLRHHRVEFRICDGYERRRGSQDPDDCMDRLVFPRGHPEFVQTLLDSVKPPGCE